MKRTFLVLVTLFLVASPAIGQESAEALFKQANQSYQNGRFEDAARDYMKAVETGVEDSALYYNLGNAQLRLGKLGSAIANFMRAEKLSPRDPDISFNLEYARNRIKARLPELPSGPFTKAALDVAGYFTGNEWTTICLLFYWACLPAIMALVLSSRQRFRGVAKIWLAVTVALLLVVLPFTWYAVNRDHYTDRAVVVAQKVNARSGPGEDNANIFELYEGMDVEVSQCSNAWCRVNTGGFIGWVPADSFEHL